jgi:hypothetical protein
MDVEVVNSLPWFFGAGAFQVRNPVVRSALVAHMPWQIGGGATLHFVKHDEGVGFKSHHGARTGWLMFIGIPLDFHNTACIRDAMNTFGEFHYWQHRDVQKCRALVYATFPSPALVPRDVVFRQPNVGRFCGIRHSWTAPCFILSADFADVHPADEEPMPFNGNPHPLPGHIHVDDHMFVLPEYPQLGWNMPPPPMFPDAPLPPGPPPNMPAEPPLDSADSAISSASAMGGMEVLQQNFGVQQVDEDMVDIGVMQGVNLPPQVGFAEVGAAVDPVLEDIVATNFAPIPMDAAVVAEEAVVAGEADPAGLNVDDNPMLQGPLPPDNPRNVGISANNVAVSAVQAVGVSENVGICLGNAAIVSDNAAHASGAVSAIFAVDVNVLAELPLVNAAPVSDPTGDSLSNKFGVVPPISVGLGADSFEGLSEKPIQVSWGRKGREMWLTQCHFHLRLRQGRWCLCNVPIWLLPWLGAILMSILMGTSLLLLLLQW